MEMINEPRYYNRHARN